MRAIADRALVAALHLPPSLSLSGFPGRDAAMRAIERDVETALDGGSDAILLENENDKPHTLLVSKAQIAWLTEVCSYVRRLTRAPVGLNVQRIDWEANLAIAVAAELDFVRLDVFVDRVRMQGEDVMVDPREVMRYRASLGGDAVSLFTDVQVKHAELLSVRPLEESAREASLAGAEVVIVTGERTGQPPSRADLEAARRGAEGARIAIGSGLDAANARGLAAFADLAIVGTSLKEGDRISRDRVRAVVAAWRDA